MEAPEVGTTPLLGRRRTVIPLHSLHLLQDDPIQEHGQLGGEDLDAGRPVRRRSWKAKDTLFEAFVPQAPAVFLPCRILAGPPCGS